MTEEKPSAYGRIKHCGYYLAEEKLHINLTLKNQGSSPIFVTAGVRRVEFDQSTGVLTLWFSDRGRATEEKDPVRKEHTTPRVEVVEAGREKTISVELPKKMTRLIPYEDGSFDFEVLNLSKANTVITKVAVSDTPFYFNPKERTLLKQLTGWGVDIEAVAKETIPPTPQIPPSERDK